MSLSSSLFYLSFFKCFLLLFSQPFGFSKLNVFYVSLFPCSLFPCIFVRFFKNSLKLDLPDCYFEVLCDSSLLWLEFEQSGICKLCCDYTSHRKVNAITLVSAGHLSATRSVQAAIGGGGIYFKPKTNWRDLTAQISGTWSDNIEYLNEGISEAPCPIVQMTVQLQST